MRFNLPNTMDFKSWENKYQIDELNNKAIVYKNFKDKSLE